MGLCWGVVTWRVSGVLAMRYFLMQLVNYHSIGSIIIVKLYTCFNAPFFMNVILNNKRRGKCI